MEGGVSDGTEGTCEVLYMDLQYLAEILIFMFFGLASFSFSRLFSCRRASSSVAKFPILLPTLPLFNCLAPTIDYFVTQNKHQPGQFGQFTEKNLMVKALSQI